MPMPSRNPDKTCSVKDGKIFCNVLPNAENPREEFTSSDVMIRHDTGKPVVSIGRDPNTGKAVREAVDGLGGMCKYVKKGDLVGLKVNITGGISTNPGSFTSKEVTKEVVDMVRSCGGHPVAFDSSMIWTDVEPIAEKEGWYKWGDENNVEIIDLHNMPVVHFKFGKDTVIQFDKASRLVKDLDVLINIPKMKTHMLTTTSVGLKNNYGLLPRADKGIYHAKDIDSSIADVNKAFPSTLTIVDAMIAGEGEAGPLTPDPVEYNTIIASNDVACADAVAATMMGFSNPMDIRHLKMATLQGVGDGMCHDRPEIRDEINRVMERKPHPKDLNFSKPDPRVIQQLADITKAIASSPGGASTMSNVADMFLGNSSYYATGFMQLMLKGLMRVSRRYIGKDANYSINPSGMNLHPEDDLDSYLL